MKHPIKLHSSLFIAFTMALASCGSKTTQSRILADRTEAAEEAFENGAIDKAELLKVLFDTDLERGRLTYKKNRLIMAKNPSHELILDPPLHYRHRSMLDKARKNEEISEEEYVPLLNIAKNAHAEWLARRRKIVHDRASWGYLR